MPTPISQDAISIVAQNPEPAPSTQPVPMPPTTDEPRALESNADEVSTWPETRFGSPEAPYEALQANVGAKAGDLPQVVGYEVLDELGRGGMGVVYRARDLTLGRIVALKMLRTGALANSHEIQRFYREAQAAAQLNHPHLVPVYEVRQHGELHYFSMAFVKGGTLADQLDRFRADPKAAVALVEKLSRAVHHAHCHHILHRDLKPSNILLDERGEPLISDFGLAKMLDSALELTRPGDMVGTPLYMAPEQATGRSDQATPASDIWALGVILYELFTGQRPFGGQSREEVFHGIQSSDPPRPRSVDHKLPTDLETICLKCLEKEPARRYASAEALADDLARWQAGEPILAKPAPWPRRAWRNVRRHPLVITAAMALAFGLAGGSIGMYYTDPNRDLRALQHMLSRGRPAVLIDETGPPRWSRWQTGEAGMGLDPRDGCFSFQTITLSLLELMPDPQRQSYRFRAEVRHDVDATRMGEVGIYFGHEKLGSPKGMADSFLALGFSDGRRSLNVAKDDKGQKWHRAALHYRYYREPGVDRGLNAKALASSPKQPCVKDYLPPGPQDDATPWRPLAVEVTPAEVRTFWDNQLFALVSCADLEKCANDSLGGVSETKGLTFQFNSRSALGLYVFGGAASFRRVVIEPLPE